LQQLHRLIDNVNPAEYDIVGKLLVKFIAEDEPFQDELGAIRRLDIAISEGDTIDLGDVNWN
jgi:hypothetical protein